MTNIIAMLIDLNAGVANNLAVNTDRAFQETILEYAQQRSSILNIAKNDIIKPKKGKGGGIRSWSSSLILYDLDFKYYFLPIVVNRCLTCQ